MPYCNKLLLVCLYGTLAIGCAGKPVAESPETANAAAAAAPASLPRDYDNALVLMQSGDYQAAIPVLQAFIDKQPDYAGPYINLGIAYLRSDDQTNALAALQSAIERNPASAAAHHQIGILHREQGDFPAALQAYQRALQLNPDYALAHRNIGILYDLYLQQPGRALDHYRRYLELSAEPDTTVDRWVVDLERRSGSAQASVNQ